MYIRGSNQLANVGTGVATGAAIVGVILAGTGAITGILHGWNALAISLIVSGGVICIPGVIWGYIAVIRAKCLEVKEKEKLNKVSQAYEKSTSNL